MASARLIPRSIFYSRTFLKLPLSTQNLMTFLILGSDNDGIVEAYSVMRMINAADDDLRLLEEKGFVYVLNKEWITYIREFQSFNSGLDRRNFQISKYRELLIQVHPELQKVLVVPVKREKKKKSHGIPAGSHGEVKRSEVKKSESLSIPQFNEMMRTDYDYKKIEQDITSDLSLRIENRKIVGFEAASDDVD